MGVDLDRVREYGRLTLRKRQIESEKSDINKRLAALQPKILADFEREGVPRQPIAGIGTVSLKRAGWVRYVREDGEEITEEHKRRVLQALKDAGLGEYVKEGFNSQSLSAYFRDLVREGGDPPPELDGLLEFDEYFELAFTAAPKSERED